MPVMVNDGRYIFHYGRAPAGIRDWRFKIGDIIYHYHGDYPEARHRAIEESKTHNEVYVLLLI